MRGFLGLKALWGPKKNEVEGWPIIRGGRGPKSLSPDLSGRMVGLRWFVFCRGWGCVSVWVYSTTFTRGLSPCRLEDESSLRRGGCNERATRESEPGSELVQS